MQRMYPLIGIAWTIQSRGFWTLGLAMIDPPVPRWAARIFLAVYALGFVTAVVVMLGLLGQKVISWVRGEGGR